MSNTDKWQERVTNNLLRRLHETYHNLTMEKEVKTSSQIFRWYICYPGNNLSAIEILAVLDRQTERYSIYECKEK